MPQILCKTALTVLSFSCDEQLRLALEAELAICMRGRTEVSSELVHFTSRSGIGLCNAVAEPAWCTEHPNNHILLGFPYLFNV
jgi:hypothetical protein